MTRIQLSKITCAVDAMLSPVIEKALSDMAIPEAFIQRGKQVSFLEHAGLFGFGFRLEISGSRSELYRFYVPPEFEAAAARRVAEAADLYLPGRGTLFAETVDVLAMGAPAFDPARIASSHPDRGCDKPLENHTVLCCIVQRGMGEALERTVLEMGLCVPYVSFGKGMGLRNKLGLLRITIPVDKEILYFVVPERDADFLEDLAVHKARLDRPGQGFIYRFNVRAYAVNLRVRSGKRSHVASMEQVISALDELRGSSEWRRFTAVKPTTHDKRRSAPDASLVCLSLIAEEGSVGRFVRAAMDAGAGGATLVPLARRCFGAASNTTPGTGTSNAREGCDLIIERGISGAILEAVEEMGLFSGEVYGLAELSAVSHAVTYTPPTMILD